MKNNYINLLQGKNNIVFYSNGMEIGWELTRWCGWIRWYKKQNKDKTINVATRRGREDLYYGIVDNIYTYDIDGDYVKYRPNMYSIDFMPQKMHDKLINGVRNRFRSCFIVTPPKNTVGRNFFPKEQMDFNFTPRKENSKVINNILSKHKSRIPICISPRHRTDSPKPSRNWPEQYWKTLFTNISKTNKYLVFIIGGSSSIIKPSKNKFFIILDDIRMNNTSNIGLTIEAIKNSVLTVGQQSALPILSNYLKVSSIIWGHEKVRHQVVENPMNTKCIFFEETSVQYNTSPTLIFESIKRETIC